MFYMEALVALIVIFLLISTKSGFVYDMDKKTRFPELNLKWLLTIVAILTLIWSMCYHFFCGTNVTGDDFDIQSEF
jgi:hypothetical protein